VTVGLPWPFLICRAMASARLIGIAKPTLEVVLPKLPDDAAVSMPITWPAVFTSGPPESPSTIWAFVCSMPCSVSVPPSWSLAVIVWFSCVIAPDTTVGGPPTPLALPMAMTLSPIFTVEELPSGIVRRPDAPSSWISARRRSCHSQATSR